MLLTRMMMIGLAVAALRDCSSSASDGSDPVILRLGGQQVRRSEFDRHLSELVRRGADPGLRKEFLSPFLEERVLVLEARVRGLVQPEASREEEQAAVETLLTRALPPIVITDADIARYHEEHQAEFERPETVTLRQILVPTENEARDIRRRLTRDPKAFDLLARTRSRSPEASTGGLMGTFERGQLPPELETPAFALAPGGTSEVVRSPLGYHVLRVEAREPARQETLEQIAPRIRAQLLRDRTTQAVKTYVRQLLSRAKVNHEAAVSTPAPS